MKYYVLDHSADTSEEAQQCAKRKKTFNKQSRAAKLTEEAENMIENLPPARKRTCKVSSYK